MATAAAMNVSAATFVSVTTGSARLLFRSTTIPANGLKLISVTSMWTSRKDAAKFRCW